MGTHGTDRKVVDANQGQRRVHTAKLLDHPVPLQMSCFPPTCPLTHVRPLIPLRKVKVKSFSHARLCVPMDCSLPGSSIRGLFQARVLEGVAISFSRGSKPHIISISPELWATPSKFKNPPL